MTALPPNVSVCRSTSALLQTPDSLLNLTAAVQAASGQSLAPLCTHCCCGFLNRLLTVAFMVSLAFAIVVGNVITLTVFVQTRQSRTPQGYLKGKGVLLKLNITNPASVHFFLAILIKRNVDGMKQPSNSEPQCLFVFSDSVPGHCRHDGGRPRGPLLCLH